MRQSWSLERYSRHGFKHMGLGKAEHTQVWLLASQGKRAYESLQKPTSLIWVVSKVSTQGVARELLTDHTIVSVVYWTVARDNVFLL